MKNLFLMLCLLSCTNLAVQNNDSDPVQAYLKSIVSNDDHIGTDQLNSFSDSTIYEVSALYLGQIKEETGKIYKIMNVIHYTGLLEDAKRGRGEILVYNNENDLLGEYGVGGITRLPIKIDANKILIFNPDGICTEKTGVDFSNGPPDKIFINCTSKGGDLFDFKKIE